MYQIDVPSASQTLPAPTALGQPGYFTDGDVVSNVDPTVVPAEFLNAVMLEMLAVLASAGIVPTKGVNNQLASAISTIAQSRPGGYGVDVGTVNSYAVAYAPAITAPTDGLMLIFKASSSNTGPAVFAPNGVAARPILGGAHQPLQGGEINAGGEVEVIWHAALNSWILLDSTAGAVQVGNALQSRHASTAGQVQNNGFCFGNDTGVANAYAVAYTPAITALTPGMVLEFKAANANTGAVTFAPNGLAAKPIIGGAHNALQGGEIVAGGIVEVMLHPTLNAWVLLGCTGGAQQVGAATQSLQAPNLGQVQTLLGAVATTYVNSPTTLAQGRYLIDTSAGSFSCPLPAAPALGTAIELIDVAKTWGINPCTLLRNGQTFMAKAEDHTLNVSNQRLFIWFNGTDWRLV